MPSIALKDNEPQSYTKDDMYRELGTGRSLHDDACRFYRESDEVLYIRFDRRTYNSWYVQIEVQIAFCGILQRMPQNAIWISIWKPRKLFSTH